MFQIKDKIDMVSGPMFVYLCTSLSLKWTYLSAPYTETSTDVLLFSKWNSSMFKTMKNWNSEPRPQTKPQLGLGVLQNYRT